MQEGTRWCLMAAAEGILVQHGVNALSVRKIGDAAGLNPTLVTYHFGSLHGLLDALCTSNLEPILAAWSQIGTAEGANWTLDDVLHAWLTPMLHPAKFTSGGRALVVLDELAAHGDAALKSRVLSAMEAFALRLREVVGPLIPHLTHDQLRARLRFISGAVLGPPPRIRAAPLDNGCTPLDALAYLLPFARAALRV